MIELVWDANRKGTGRGPSGASLHVGDDTQFAPEDLLGMAAASSLMAALLESSEAAIVSVLSYLSTAEIVHGAGAGSRGLLRVRAFVTTAHSADRTRLEGLIERTKSSSSIASLLGDRLDFALDARGLTDAARE